jgi:chromosomal replication initiator protein
VQALGREVFDSWFGKVTLTRIESGIALLRTSSKFTAKWLTDHYAAQTIEAWRAEAPGLVGVKFDHRAPTHADDAPLAAGQPAVQP